MDREKVIKDNAIRGLQSAIEISGALVHLRKEHAKAILALLQDQEHKDRMFHALEDDWKRLNGLLKEQQERIETLESLRRIEQKGR